MPASAQATPPTREPVLIEDFILTDHCGFDIDVDVVKNNEIQTTYYDADGNVVRQRVTGSLKVQAHQPGEFRALPCSSTSPDRVKLRELPDGSTEQTGSGTWIHFGITDQPGALLLMHGRFTANISDEGFFLTETPNNTQDVCALLS